MTRKGRAVSLYVDAGKLNASAHAGLECVSCHEGFNPSDVPHAKKIRPVNCVACHDGEQFVHFSQSVHGALKGGVPVAGCADCHSAHAVVNVTAESPEARKQFALSTCTRCHAAEQAKFLASDHGAALSSGVTGAPTCIDCHDEHNVRKTSDSTAQTSRAKVAAMCLRCHIENRD
ncbi:MAG TPA: cytochrome c3 family protein, partial [Bacteroidota bacterium]|nr:cytochrome c3 family protein [Bacteroidota bacterium]